MSNNQINELADAVMEIKERQEAKDFLKNILTPGELDEIVKRLQIIKLLKKGVPQREIAKKLDVSIGTITRGSRELKYGAPGFKKII
ncbi:MAG: YerC/YecD family TrpR-related protein [Candidatus Peregrinibacteria bacterium]|nr:YerC/YecD family TrpR-related protein [Candidatus Peregrinibacteria bacterium]